MPRLSRRQSFALAAGLLPRVAIAAADTRPTITVAVQRIATSNTLDILNEASNVGTRHYNLYTEPLIDTDWTGDLALRPGLAESWRRLDERTLEFTLRPGVKFHNGDELTAEEVAFTFGERLFGTAAERAADPARRDPRWAPPKVRAGARAAYPAIDRIEVTGRNTFQFINKVPDVTLEGRLSMRTGVIVASRPAREAASWSDWARQPIGTGPYRVADYKAETHLVLDAFDDYWGGRPPLARIRFLEVPELASRINGLLAGEFDFACDITPDQIPVIERSPRHEVAGGIIANQRVLMLDQHHPVLADPRIRRALAHGIDRQAIVDTLWGGRTRVPKGLQFEFYGAMYLPDWSVPEYDPALAKRLLADSGYQGAPIIFRTQNGYYTNQGATAQIVAEMWQAIGVDVRIELKENWSQVLDPKGGRAIFDNSMTAFFNDPVSFMPTSFAPDGELAQLGSWRNAEAEAAVATMAASTDMTQRRAAFRRSLEIIEREDPALIVLHETANFTAKRRDILWKPARSFVMDFRARNFALRRA